MHMTIKYILYIYSLLQHHTQMDDRELKCTLQSLVDAKLLTTEVIYLCMGII